MVTLAAAAGATAANREVYDICYASCPAGMACDAATGLCVRLPCGGKCTADRRCKLVDGKETCVLGEPDRGVVPLPAEPGAGDLGPVGPGRAPGDGQGPPASRGEGRDTAPPPLAPLDDPR